jgi:hypothetical protein
MSFKRNDSIIRIAMFLVFIMVVVLLSTIVWAENNEEPRHVDVWLDHYNWYGTDGDSIENIMLSWEPSRSMAVAGLHVEDAEVHYPKFELETDLNLIGFNPDDSEVFTAYPEEKRYVWHFTNLIVRAPQSCVVHFRDAQDYNLYHATPKFSATRSVVPETLTEDVTTQTVTLTFTLEENLPALINTFGVWIGRSIIAYEDVQLVEGYIVEQTEVEGWESGTDGIQAWWHIEPNNIQMNKTFVFEAKIESIKSEYLIGAPLFKPGILIGYGRGFPEDYVIGKEVTIQDPEKTMKATISADKELKWSSIYGDHGHDFWFNEIISKITIPPDKEPPPYYVLIPAEVEIHPETLLLSSSGVFTAYVQLPPPYSVYDIDISTVVCEGAEAIRGSIEDDILTLHFWRQDLHDIELGEEVEFMITGKLTDGTLFEGKDTIRVLD